MHKNNCYNCKFSALYPGNPIFAFETITKIECRNPQGINKSVINSSIIMNFISVLGCASFESNEEKKE